MVVSDRIIDITLRIRDDVGNEHVLGKEDMRGLVIESIADGHTFKTGGPWASDGRTTTHHMLFGIDHNIVITMGYYEPVLKTSETIEVE